MKRLTSLLGVTSMCTAGLFTIAAIACDAAGKALYEWSDDA
ncbi:hypothetical protein [Rhodococcus sp. 2G]|nr:hypothetical protein [Rhodococcus sp. 2G]